MSALARRAAIVGIGATEFSRCSGRSEERLAVEAVTAAIDDAGLRPTDVDGMVTFSMESTPEIQVARNLGIPLRYFGQVPHGGGAAGGCVLQATMAVTTGVADVVVCYRAINERSGQRFGADLADMPLPPSLAIHFSLYAPFGLGTAAQMVAMAARRYMRTYGVTSEDLGRVSVVSRRYAATNPVAIFRDRPISLEDHQRSRWIAEPLRLLDCCQETDGAQAFVVTSVERARDLLQPAVAVDAVAQGAVADQGLLTGYYDDDVGRSRESELVAAQLYRDAGLTPADIRCAILYDHFTPAVLWQLEAFGFCCRGEAADFVRAGGIEPGGALPVNTNGGQLGEAYVHGMNGVAEGVRQVRGTAVNQVPMPTTCSSPPHPACRRAP